MYVFRDGVMGLARKAVARVIEVNEGRSPG
jgi:hypothetical protein